MHAPREYQKTLKIDPDNKDAHLGLGLIYFEKGLDLYALREYQKVLDMEPGNQFAMGMIETIRKDLSQARPND